MSDRSVAIAPEPIARADASAYLGRRARVLVDRPLGSRHPDHRDLIYRLNYGYLPGTRGGDGEPIDAYVLGIGLPVAEATGVAVAVVVREDDDEDKLVVAADGRRYAADEIGALVAFQERFFRSRIETAAGETLAGASEETG